MSDTKQAERPRQATVAAWMIMAGSAFVVVSVFEQVAGLHTLDAREAAERVVSEPPGNGLGLDVDTVLTLMRVLAMVAAGCATATAILGFYVLRRSHSARLGLSILAVPLFLSGMVVGGFLSSVVAVAVLLLWLQPTRDWFDGTSRPSAPRETAARPADRSGDWRATPPRTDGDDERTRVAAGQGAAPPQADEQPSAGSSGGEPRAVAGFGSASSAPWTPSASTSSASPTPGQPTYPAAPAAPGWQVDPAGAQPPRPATVVWACLLTWVLGGLTVLAMLVSMVALLAAPDAIFEQMYRQNPELEQQGVTQSTLAAATLVMAAFAVVWAAAAMVVAVFVWRRAGWARLVLVVSAAAAAGLFLIGTAGSLVLLVPLLACVLATLLLLRPETRAWFAAGREGQR